MSMPKKKSDIQCISRQKPQFRRDIELRVRLLNVGPSLARSGPRLQAGTANACLVRLVSTPQMVLGRGTDQTHFAANHIEDLWQLVQPRGPQKRAERDQAAVTHRVELRHRSVVRFGFRTQLHAPEFEHREPLPAKADAFLPVDQRTL